MKIENRTLKIGWSLRTGLIAGIVSLVAIAAQAEVNMDDPNLARPADGMSEAALTCSTSHRQNGETVETCIRSQDPVDANDIHQAMYVVRASTYQSGEGTTMFASHSPDSSRRPSSENDR